MTNEQLRAITIKPNGTVVVPAHEIPLSIYMSEEAKRAFVRESHAAPIAEVSTDMAVIRGLVDRQFLSPQLERMIAACATIVEEGLISGIRTEVVIPRGGIADQHKDHVLINLHGGGFCIGAGMLQRIESIPIAAAARIKVVSIDYRLAPEHRFPAASEDVATVYRDLLLRYEPTNIGIFGHSAGGYLAAMSLAWFQKENLPMPGAVGIFSAPDPAWGGDSLYTAAALNAMFGSNAPPPTAEPNPPPSPLAAGYLAGIGLADPLVSPALYPEVLARFPPTLLITGTRDVHASHVIFMHRQLVKAGRIAELHAWEGMWHSFIQDVDIPESREMYEVTANFFNRHLGRAG